MARQLFRFDEEVRKEFVADEGTPQFAGGGNPGSNAAPAPAPALIGPSFTQDPMAPVAIDAATPVVSFGGTDRRNKRRQPLRQAKSTSGIKI